MRTLKKINKKYGGSSDAKKELQEITKEKIKEILKTIKLQLTHLESKIKMNENFKRVHNIKEDFLTSNQSYKESIESDQFQSLLLSDIFIFNDTKKNDEYSYELKYELEYLIEKISEFEELESTDIKVEDYFNNIKIIFVNNDSFSIDTFQENINDISEKLKNIIFKYENKQKFMIEYFQKLHSSPLFNSLLNSRVENLQIHQNEINDLLEILKDENQKEKYMNNYQNQKEKYMNNQELMDVNENIKDLLIYYKKEKEECVKILSLLSELHELYEERYVDLRDINSQLKTQLTGSYIKQISDKFTQFKTKVGEKASAVGELALDTIEKVGKKTLKKIKKDLK